MLRVYLDQNKWIDLSRALHGEPEGDRYRDVLTIAGAAAKDGHASFPLSSGHVFETWKARRAEMRQPLAQVMAALSRNHAIAPPWQIVPAELDRAFQRRFGRPFTVLPLQPFGFGMRHRSGDAALDLDSEVRCAVLEANPGLTDVELTAWLDTMLLVGPPEDLPTSDISQPPLGLAQGYRDEEALPKRSARALAARMLINLGDPFHEAQVRARVATDDVLGLQAEGLTDFMLDLPSQAGVLELHWLLHDNPENKWAANDLVDITYLSLAVAYCDVVVTEKKWTHLFNRTDLPARFDTRVFNDLTDLTEILLSDGARS
jgi:hypothetical protein